MQMAVTLQNHSEIFKFPVFSLCFSEIFKFPVFSLSGITFHNFPCFPCAVGTLLWVENFNEITLCCTVKANLCFSILGKNSKIQNGRHMWGGENFFENCQEYIS